MDLLKVRPWTSKVGSYDCTDYKWTTSVQILENKRKKSATKCARYLACSMLNGFVTLCLSILKHKKVTKNNQL